MAFKNKKSALIYKTAIGFIFAIPFYTNMASAQQADEKAKTKPAVDTAIVTGVKIPNKIDRQVHDVSNDIAAQTGSAADALNKVPGVTVDGDGNVALRGNQNVQILINGKQNAMMKGDNRGMAVLSMGGADIESVEIMNNPGAGFSSEGSGGIINLVLKKNRKPGKYITLVSTAGEDGRFNANTNVSYNRGKFNFTGGANYRKDSRTFDTNGTTTRKIVGANNVATSTNSGTVRGQREGYGANFGVDYNLDDNNTIATQISFSSNEMNPSTSRDYQGFDINNSLISEYDFVTNRVQNVDAKGAAINWEHKFKTPSRTLKTDLRYSNEDGETNYTDTYLITLPSTRNYQNLVTQVSNRDNWVFSLDYSTPLGDKSIVTSGWQTTIDAAQFDNKGVIVENNIVTNDNSKTNQFEYNQAVNALYFTYQTQLNEKWTAQIGARAEGTQINTYNPVSGLFSSSEYINVSPSTFATYTLNPRAKLRFTYARRLQRPKANDLNPTPEYMGSEAIRVGNPNLKPMTTDAFEIGYEWAKGPANASVRTFYRLNNDVISTYSTFIENNVVKTTSVNAGQSENSGLELNLTRKFFDKLNVSLNSNISYISQDALYGVTDKVTGTAVGARVMLDYAATKKDRMQFMLGTRGKEITAQGYSTPQIMSMVSYSRQLNPAMYFVANMTNPFDLEEVKTVTETDVLKSVTYRNMQPRVFYLGFRMMMGARPKGQSDTPNMMPPGPPMRHGGGAPMM
jgi:outer membrane receptor protein involved in Fe transport